MSTPVNQNPKNPASSDQSTQSQTDSAARFTPEKEIFSWKSPARPFKRRDKEFWVRTVVIVTVLGAILYIVEGMMPVLLLIAVLFFFYILSTVEPEVVQYKITNLGLRVAEKLNDWNLFTRFWFTKRMSTDMVVFETFLVPGRLELVINPADVEKLKAALIKFIPEEEAPPTRFDKASEWISKKFIER